MIISTKQWKQTRPSVIFYDIEQSHTTAKPEVKAD